MTARILLVIAFGTAIVPRGQCRSAESTRRVPVAVAASETAIYTANRDGSITAIDRGRGEVRSIDRVGKRLSHIVFLPTTRHLLATDRESHELLLISTRGAAIRVVQRLAVPSYPVRVVTDADQSVCLVTSLWSQRATIVDLDVLDGPLKLATREVIDLPFAPNRAVLAGQPLQAVIADAFGGRLIAADLERLSERSSASFMTRVPGHNIRGLAADGDSVFLSLQTLDPTSETTHDQIFWGGVIRNLVQTLPLAHVASGRGGNELPEVPGSRHPLGNPSEGAGDPADLAITPTGQMIVALSGTDEVSVRTERRQPFLRRSVGRRPVAVTLAPDHKLAYVANSLDDSVTEIEVATAKATRRFVFGGDASESVVQRGERLFFDARLSVDGWFSCHSCHTDGHSNRGRTDNLGDGSFGAPKQVLSLLGAGETRPWAWTGEQADLNTQIAKSIRLTMRGETPGEEDVAALAAFVQTLKPPPGVDVARGNPDDARVARGRELFRKRECTTCHAPPLYTSPESFDVELVDEKGLRHFNPPSLRGVSQRGPYFHDGRAATLQDVLENHPDADGPALSAPDRDALLAFLRRL